MKRILLLVSACLVYISPAQATQSATPGTPVWTLADQDNIISNTIETKVDDLDNLIASDMDGTFTALDDLLTKMCTVQSQAEQLVTQVNIIEINFNHDVSKLCTIESKVNALEQQVVAIDTQSSFTALEALQTTLCSKIEQLNAELIDVEDEITNITQTQIEHTQTIASKLSVIDSNMNTVNSILDNITFDVSLNTIDSLIDAIDVCLQTVDSKLEPLESTIEINFAGTFTALDANLQKACTIESLVDNIPMSFMADLSGVYTSLSQLDKTICTIESKVDNLDMNVLTIESDVDILNSTIDQTLAKLCALESKTDVAACSECFSLLENIGTNLSNDCSILEELNNNQLLEKTCTIDSNLDIVINDLELQNSKLEVINSETEVVESKICAIEMNSTSISKLDVIDSKLDSELMQATTICSLIEEINEQLSTIDSNTDSIDQSMQTIESKVCEFENDTFTICSNLDILDPTLQTVDSKLDNIGSLTQSSLENLLIVESEVDAICSKLELIGVGSLNSKLDNIESIVCTIESNMDIVGGLIGEAEMKAMDLEDDFGQTWTILDTIENKLCTSESELQSADDNLQSLIDIVDFSSIFTVVKTIQMKACTVDSKVDVAISLIDDVDFSGVFTALDALESKVCLIDDLVQTVSTGVFVIRDALGTPIYQSDVGTTGYIIETPGRYYLAENIQYAPTTENNAAIGINADNVFLDLNGMTLSQTSTSLGVDGILFSFIDNIAIANGSIDGFTSVGIEARDNSRNLIISDVNTTNNLIGLAMLGINLREIVLRRLVSSNNEELGIDMFFDDPGQGLENLVIRDSSLLGNGSRGLRVVSFPGLVNNLSIVNSIAKANGSDGIFLQGQVVENGTIENCISSENGRDGIRLQAANGTVVKSCAAINNQGGGIVNNSFNIFECSENVIIDNSVIGNVGNGINLREVNADVRDNYIARNNMVENAINIHEDGTGSGPNTFLGNFALNSTAAGSPDNTNYTMSLSNITGKFVTVAQNGAFPATEPTEWHNINMLP